MTGKTLAMAAAAICGLLTTAPLTAQAPKEGIVVRGHWVMEVRNPDGSLAQRREFDNGLVDGGKLLVALLNRTRTAGFWTISLTTTGGAVAVTEPLMPVPDSPGFTFKNLELSPTPNLGSFPQSPQLMLSGVATANADYWVSRVETSVLSCLPNQQQLCGLRDILTFSGVDLPRANPTDPGGVELKNKQFLQVSVTISFDSSTHLPPSH